MRTLKINGMKMMFANCNANDGRTARQRMTGFGRPISLSSYRAKKPQQKRERATEGQIRRLSCTREHF